MIFLSKNQTEFNRILAATIVIFTAYIIACCLGMQLLCDILSPLNAGLAAAILAYAYFLSDRKGSLVIALPAISLACLAWTIADILWAVLAFCGGAPAESLWTIFFYSLTNIFLGIAVLIYMFYQFNKWDSFQLLLDTAAVVFTSAILVWIIVFQKSEAWFRILVKDGVLSVISISLDFLIITGVFVCLLSMRKVRIPASLFLFGAGLFLFAITDVYYYYIYANDLYIPNSLFDTIYVASLLLLAFAALWQTLGRPSVNTESINDNGFKHKWVLLFLFILILVYYEGIVLSDILIFFLIILLYHALSSQVQLAIKNSELYHKELEINRILEKRVEEQFSELTFLANHDTVTKLHNRRYFVNYIENSMKELLEHEVLAIFLIDVDRFKSINDTFGHDVGDEVLIEISDRMLAFENYSPILARLGGDEFALSFQGKYTKSELEAFCRQIIDRCSSPIVVGKNLLHVTISVGISIFPADAGDRSTIMKNADIAMYRAKSQGYNRYVFFDPFFTESNSKRSEIEVLLRKANIERDFELFYQPQYSLPNKKLIGAEALIRWKSAEHGYICPNEFIPVAEEIDYMFRISKWVMLKAIKQIIKWNTKYSVDLKMGVNISAGQLKEDGLINNLRDLINSNRLNTAWIDAEITENLIIEDGKRADNILDLFKKLSISVSIDNFGKGFSLEKELHKELFDRIKIDKKLVGNLSDSQGVKAIKDIIDLAKVMNIKTIAEGVETQKQFDILSSLGCSQAQGYLLGRPAPALVFEELFIKDNI